MCDYDPCDVYSASTREARKAHKCGECRREIMPGETYHRVRYLFEGTWGSHVMCEPCAELAASLADVVDGGDWALGALHQDALEAVDYGLCGDDAARERFRVAMRASGLAGEEG